MKTTQFYSFNEKNSGRIITSITCPEVNGGYSVFNFIYARNPYGSHNLIVVHEDGRGSNLCNANQAYAHGNYATLCAAFNFDSNQKKKVARKLLAFLAKKGKRYPDFFNTEE